MADKRDYYEVLGVKKDATADEIKKAYRKLTKENHPDLHPGDKACEERFKEANEAYEVLSDEEKRKKYDQYGQNWKEADAFNQAGGNAGGGTEFHWSSSGGGSPFDGFDFSSFGSGGGGFSSFFEDLFGHGAGHGFSSRSARTSTGEMNAKVNIDLYTALLGGEVIIQLSNGSKIKLKVKPETQNGTRVRLRGKGYDRGDGTYGDLIITYNVTLPTNLSERQKQLLNEMRYAG